MKKTDEPQPPAGEPSEPATLKVRRERRRLYDPMPAARETSPAPAAAEPAARRKGKARKATAKRTARKSAASPPSRASAAPHEGVDLPTRDEAALALVRKSAAWSAAIGLLPLPLVDAAAVSVIQVRMIRSLADHYGVDYSEHRAKALVASLLGVVVPASFVYSAGRILRALPGPHLLAGLLAPGSCGAATYALGWVFVQHFARGGTLHDLDPARARTALEQEAAG